MAIALSALVGCSTAPVVTAPPIGEVSEVRLRGPIEELGVVRDRADIELLRAIVNENREGWSTPWYGPPIPKRTFVFYDGEDVVGDLGVGDGFVARNVSRYSRSITGDEMRELERIADAAERSR